MTARLFDNRLSQEWVGFTILRRLIVAVAIVHFSLAAVSGYRAVVQIYSVSIDTPRVIQAGSQIRGHVSTAGRTYVDVHIDLIQGRLVEQIGFMRVTSNESFFYDPRAKKAVLDTLVPADVLTRFKAGPADLRIVAEGHSQWLHIPPPKVQRVVVELR